MTGGREQENRRGHQLRKKKELRPFLKRFVAGGCSAYVASTSRPRPRSMTSKIPNPVSHLLGRTEALQRDEVRRAIWVGLAPLVKRMRQQH